MDVSRETSQLFAEYEALLRKWTSRINLISSRSLDQLRERHIADCAQLFELIPDTTRSLVDIGTGAGLPGLVLAIMARDRPWELAITLVESDQRKSSFCRTVVRELGLNAKVLTGRAEELPPIGAEVVTARALARLPDLLGYAERHMSAGGQALFLKGKNHEEEVAAALANWTFKAEKIPSKTDPLAVILSLKDIARV